MTFAERQAIADGLEAIKEMKATLADLQARMVALEEAATAPVEIPRPKLTMKARANG